MPQRSVLTERNWTVTVTRDFWYAGVWRQVGDSITVPVNVARGMIEAGNAVNRPDWPVQFTNMPWALQNVTPSSGDGSGSPAGSNGEIQFNDNGAFGASSALRYYQAFRTNSVYLGDYENNVNGLLAITAWDADAVTPNWPSVSFTSNGDLNFETNGNFSVYCQIGGQVQFPTGRVCIGQPPADYPLNVQGDVNIYDPGNANGYAFRINGVPISAGAQTPWLSNIDAGGFTLNDLTGIFNSNKNLILSSDFNTSINAGSGSTIYLQIGGASFLQASGSPVTVTVYRPLNIYSTLSAQRLNLNSLPTSPTGLNAGDIWNNGGVLNIVT